MIGKCAVVTVDLVKRYGRRCALDGFSLSVPEGSVLGLVGPNGAGKTTWMMSVAGLTRLDSGEVSLLGRGSFDANVHSGRVSILPQDSEIPLELTPYSFLYGLCSLQGLSSSEAKASVCGILSALNLSNYIRASVRSLSHGMRKRLMVAQCFLGDPEEAVRFRDIILAGRGKRTVVISSHDLTGLERLCTHFAFVEAGRVTRFFSLEDLAASSQTLEEAYLNRSCVERAN